MDTNFNVHKSSPKSTRNKSEASVRNSDLNINDISIKNCKQIVSIGFSGFD